MRATFSRGSRNPHGFSPLALGIAVIVAMAALIATQSGASAAQSPVSLGTAGNYEVLAGTLVTNTGLSQITGNLGVYPGTGVSGFPPGTITGTQDDGDDAAQQAQSDLTAAYSDAAGRAPAASVSGDLEGETLTPGVYNAATSLGITGTVTLDAQGDPDSVFIFQIGTTLVTASDANVALTGGAQAANVFWQVGTTVALGANSTLQGNILALTSITGTTGATVYGRALVIDGAIVLDDNTITDLVPALTITKSADAAAIMPGGTVHYTITVADTGQTAYTDAALTDPLTGVLDDAAYNNDGSATAGIVSFTAPNLTWTGDLGIGETATITYSVTVNSSDDTGDLTLASKVISPTPGSNCPSGSTDPRCSVTVAVAAAVAADPLDGPAGVLSISAPASADDIGAAAPGGTVSAALGVVQVTDNRASLAVNWTATVSSTDFTTGGGTAAETIPVDDVQYSISGFTATTGSATFTPTAVTDMSTAPQTVVAATNVLGDNSASWDPGLHIAVPSEAVAGTYAATITYSVS